MMEKLFLFSIKVIEFFFTIEFAKVIFIFYQSNRKNIFTIEFPYLRLDKNLNFAPGERFVS